MNTEIKVKGRDYIKIIELEKFDNKLTAKLDFSKNNNKYFLANIFIAEYDVNIRDIDESILIIPPMSIIIPIAWATGSDVYIETIDKSYMDFLENLKNKLIYIFPEFSFSGKIHATKIISNKFSNKGYALLFSGGLDSMISYIRNKDLKPILISLWGADIPIHESKFWNIVRDKLFNFANKEGINIHIIKSNIQEIPNHKILINEYNIESWWGSISHGLVLSSICSPLLSIKGIDTIFSASPGKDINDGTTIMGNNNVIYADIKNIQDGYELSRQDKIKILKNNPSCLSYLRVCWRQHLKYNCGYCEKCLRTITGLILENVDPKVCNFNVKDNILEMVRIYLSKSLFNFSENEIIMWQDIQNHIHVIADNEINKKYKSEKFFIWFKTFDFSKYKYGHKNKFCRFYYTVKYVSIKDMVSNIFQEKFQFLKKYWRTFDLKYRRNKIDSENKKIVDK